MTDTPSLDEERCARLRILIEHADQVILGLYDANTTELLEASPHYLGTLERIHSHPHGSLIGRTWQELAPSTPGETADEVFRSVLETGRPRRLREVHLKLPVPAASSQESEAIWDFTLTPVHDPPTGEGQAARYVVVSAVEVTDQVRARQELERMDRTKDVFLSIASHELRTPLVPLMGYAGMLSDIAARKEKEENPTWDKRIGTYISHFQRQLEHLSRMIDDLFDSARLHSGRLSLKQEKVDLARIVQQAVESARLMSDRHKISLTIADEGRPWLMMGDEERLAQVLSNLLRNAIIHAPESEQIDVRMIRLHNGGAEEQVIIEVQDYGPGIPPDELASLFTRFYQGSQSVASRKERPKDAGLGLGLYIAKGLVEQHGGTIDARSEVGKGTTFVVKLTLS